MLNIAFFGPPGAGKGTQACRIAEKYNLEHISTGELIRKEISEGTELGLMAADIINNGHLLSDEFVVGLLENHMSKAVGVNGFLFDGFPRTVSQALILDELLKIKGETFGGLFNIIVPFDELLTRMLKRAEIEGRVDDNREVIENRFKEYNHKTVPVENHYREKGLCFDIDGNQSMDKVFQEISSKLELIKKNNFR